MKMIAGAIVLLAGATFCSAALLGFTFGSESRNAYGIVGMVFGFALGVHGCRILRDGIKESGPA